MRHAGREYMEMNGNPGIGIDAIAPSRRSSTVRRSSRLAVTSSGLLGSSTEGGGGFSFAGTVLPRQTNGCDCGVFVSGFMHALCDVRAYADPEADLLSSMEQVLEASKRRFPPVLWGFGQAQATRGMRLSLGAGMLLRFMP